MSSRSPTRASRRSADSSIASFSSSVVLGRPVHLGRPQAADRSLDAGQRGAQVVRDRRQQGGPRGVVAGELADRARRALQFLALQDGAGVRGEGVEQATVTGGKTRRLQDELVGAVRVLVVGDGQRVEVPDRGDHLRRADRRPVDDRCCAHAEHVHRATQQERQLVGGAQQGVGQLGQRGALRLRRLRLLGAAGVQVHDQGDEDADEHEDHQRDRVLRIGNGEGADRLARRTSSAAARTATAATIAGTTPPMSATVTVASRKIGMSSGRSSVNGSASRIQVSNGGSRTAAPSPPQTRRRDSPRPRRRPKPLPAFGWVTTCTSMSPESAMIRLRKARVEPALPRRQA